MPKRTVAGTGGTVPKQRAEREQPATFTWTVEFTVTENWVADGFNLTDERAHAMLAHDLVYAYGHELQAKVVAAPDANAIRTAQGYEPRTRVLFWAKPNLDIGARLLGAAGFKVEWQSTFDRVKYKAWVMLTSATVDDVRRVFEGKLQAFEVEVA